MRDDGELRYQVGTSELLDLSVAARRVGIEGHDLSPGIVRRLTQAVSAIAKHPDDAQLIRDRLEALGASGSSM